MIRIGIIGCGHWGMNHIRIFSQTSLGRVVLCADRDAGRRVLVRRLYPNVKILSDYRDMLKNHLVDAVVVATPTATHFDLVKECLEHNRHVLCEKPLTTRLWEAEQLVALARKKKRLLFVGHTFLFNLGIQRLAAFIREGRIGRPLYIRSLRTNLGPIRDDVNVVWDLASHDISILCHLLDKDPLEVTAKGAMLLTRKIEEIAVITFTYPRNVIATVQVSWLDPRKVREITVVGSKKMAIWDDLNPDEPIRIYDKGVMKERDYRTFGEFHYLSRDGDIVIPKIRLVEPLQVEGNAFLEGIANGGKVISDGEMGVRVTRILEAVQASIRKKGLPVKVTHG